MERDDAARPNASCEPAQHASYVCLKQQYVPANHRIEALVECEPRRVALKKRDVSERARLSSLPGGRNRGRGAVDADDRALVADQSRTQERHVAATATDLEDSHSRDNPRSAEELSGDRFYQACL